MKEQLRIVAPLHAFTGYSHFARAALHTALVAGYEVEAVESDYGIRDHFSPDVCGTFKRSRETYVPYYEPRDPRDTRPFISIPDAQLAEIKACMETRVSPDAPTLLMLIPPNLGAFPKYGKGAVIGWTMTESDDMVPLWRHNARCVDLLVAPSRYCLDTFRKAVPEVSSALLPIPVDDRLWMPDEFVSEVPGKPPFLFFTAFTTSERKQWRQMMQAFAEEFAGEQDEVGLLMKPSRWPEVEQMAGCCREMGAWVYVHPEPCTDWIMGSLYRACNVYVQASSEGFGLGPVEAGLCGRPSIALSLGGAADVVDEDCGYLVPSAMEPVIGHAPHWYPRTHNFATCNTDDLRTALRRAYNEERDGAKKGVKAASAMAQRFSPEVIAPGLRQIVDQAMGIRAKTQLRGVAPVAPKWATAAGAWGDVFACCGNIKQVMTERGLEEIGVVYCGKDAKIAEWLEAQPWCREVLCAIVPDKKALDQTFARLSQCRAVHARDEFLRLAQEAGEAVGVTIEPHDLAYTHLCMNEPQTPRYWSDPKLPVDAVLWASEHWEDVGRGDFLLLNPLSVASNAMHDHWPYWNEAIDWLVAESRVPVIMVGEKVIEWPAHRNLVNIAGDSKTMMDVLALAELSAGIVSTSNNLGIYAPIAGIESVIVCARTCGEETFYHRWMEREPISLLDFGDSLEMFRQAVRERFGRFLRPVMVQEEATDAVREAALV